MVQKLRRDDVRRRAMRNKGDEEILSKADRLEVIDELDRK